MKCSCVEEVRDPQSQVALDVDSEAVVQRVVLERVIQSHVANYLEDTNELVQRNSFAGALSSDILILLRNSLVIGAREPVAQMAEQVLDSFSHQSGRDLVRVVWRQLCIEMLHCPVCDVRPVPLDFVYLSCADHAVEYAPGRS